MFALLLLIPLVPLLIGLVIAFVLNPVHVFLNIIQIGLGISTLVCGTVSYFQGFFESAASGYFIASAGLWLLLVLLRSASAAVDY